MNATLEAVADLVTRRAQRQGYVVPREVREELGRAGLEEGQWREVLNLAGSALRYRSGRYHFTTPVSQRVRTEQSQQEEVGRIIRDLVRQHHDANSRVERRGQERIDFVQVVKVIPEDGRELSLLSRDLSTTGIRLVGTSRLLGQKVRVRIQAPEGGVWDFLVRILWTCPLGDGLVENGGSFLNVTQMGQP